MHSTPPSLLDRLRRPDPAQAWDQFVELYTPLLYSWTRRLGLASHDAAELVQDVFVTLVEKLPDFEYNPDKSFRAWLRTVLLNRWRNWLRSRKDLQSLDVVADVGYEPDTPEFEEAEYRQFLLRRAMQLLQPEFPPAAWQACVLVLLENQTPAQVASALGMTTNMVYLAKSRALRRLRELLQGLLD